MLFICTVVWVGHMPECWFPQTPNAAYLFIVYPSWCISTDPLDRLAGAAELVLVWPRTCSHVPSWQVSSAAPAQSALHCLSRRQKLSMLDQWKDVIGNSATVSTIIQFLAGAQEPSPYLFIMFSIIIISSMKQMFLNKNWKIFDKVLN